MTEAQQAAFKAGSGLDASSLLFAIAGSVSVFAILWVAWVTIGAFRAWRLGEIEIYDLMWQAMRAAIVLLILGYYIR